MTNTRSSEYTLQLADFNNPELIALIKIHHATVTHSDSNLPGQKMYALNISDLQDPDIQLWTISTPSNAQILGCAALKKLYLSEGLAGEVKSMHTVATSRGQGIGAFLVAKLVVEAQKIGMKRLYLETGSSEGFSKARRFYAQQGFAPCGTFGDYREQDNSVFMCKRLD